MRSASPGSDRARRVPRARRPSRQTCRPRNRDPRRCAPRSRHRPKPDGQPALRQGARGTARAVGSNACSPTSVPRGAAALLFPGVVVRAYHGAGRSTYGSNGGVAMTKRIAVVGAGAIGGYTGGHLAYNGFDVTLIDPWPAHIEAIRSEGLAIEGITAEEFIRVRPKTLHLTEVQSLAKEKPIDIAFISVKSYDTEWATLLIRPYLAPSGYVVSLQNCINEERIAAIVGWGRTVGAIAAILSAELYAPGRIRRTGAKNPPGHEVYRVGEVHGQVTARIE